MVIISTFRMIIPWCNRSWSIQAVNILEKRAHQLKEDKDRAAAGASYTYKAAGSKIHVPLMKFVDGITQVADNKVADGVLTGLPIVALDLVLRAFPVGTGQSCQLVIGPLGARLSWTHLRMAARSDAANQKSGLSCPRRPDYSWSTSQDHTCVAPLLLSWARTTVSLRFRPLLVLGGSTAAIVGGSRAAAALASPNASAVGSSPDADAAAAETASNMRTP